MCGIHLPPFFDFAPVLFGADSSAALRLGTVVRVNLEQAQIARLQ